MHIEPGTGQEVMCAAGIALITAQTFKILWYWARHRAINFRIVVQTGGMPSSHSAFMASLATAVGLVSGFDSVVFSVALGLALIVMYDAAGLRRAAGKMAGILNKITEDFYHKESEHLPERLRELLGHTPLEVLVGAFLGMVTAYAVHIRL